MADPRPGGARDGRSDVSRADQEPGRHAPGLVVLDVRSFTPALVRPFLTSVVDDLVALGAQDELVIVSGYECTGLAYQLDMRRETRGLFHYDCTQRSDGAWVETIRRR